MGVAHAHRAAVLPDHRRPHPLFRAPGARSRPRRLPRVRRQAAWKKETRSSCRLPPARTSFGLIGALSVAVISAVKGETGRNFGNRPELPKVAGLRRHKNAPAMKQNRAEIGLRK